MTRGKNKKKARNAAEASSRSLASEKTPKSLKPEPKIVKKTPKQNVAEASSKPLQSEKKTPNSLKPKPKIVNKSSNQNAVEASSKPLLSEKKTPIFLKPEPKIVKKSSNQNFSKTKEAEGTSQVQEKKTKDEKKSTRKGNIAEGTSQFQGRKIKDEKKGTQEGNKASNSNKREDIKEPNSREGNKEKSIANKKHSENSPRDQKKRGDLGGFIFMCNAKTKPDCFRYRVMGVPMSKHELVMSIKPGVKLFLYDFDLRLMYGIYKASSAGGVKLEPSAFDGGFPAQVRFEVHKDCFPLPESDFKVAIKDNYNEKTNKFKTELTVQQVRKLTELFQPAPQVHPNAQSIVQEPPLVLLCPPPMAIMPARENFKGTGEPRPEAHRREPLTREPNFHGKERKHLMSSDHERGQLHRHSIQKDAFPRDPLFLSEKEYQTYGLGREQHTSNPPIIARILPNLDPYQKDHGMEQLLRYTAPTASMQNEAIRNDPLFLSEKEYRAYGLGIGRDLPTSAPPATAPIASTLVYPRDPYYPHQYGTPSLDSSSLLPRGEAASSKSYPHVTRREAYVTDSHYPARGATEHSQRTEPEESERLYSVYASNALSDYNQRHHLGGRPELTSAPVSSRYSFGGPSLSYR
ncbi:hypothetical protein HHK36_020704 [Tetracentron sinense]|uniref:DCD domain-containing protein n=1 Tax=Tetracentron sinense TaxID=13715 RepID=A0A834YVJ9_TETSI|nr:hypothetical protein HHK36_020704 [Tetracentron sinense]